MSVKWTEEQLAAINAPVGNLLVSAAAGSGKTAVLVNRVIEKITGENPLDVNRLLIVTFTKAAAAEMKTRINERLVSLSKERPEDANIKRQLMLLEKAKIGTMDSFFSDVVKDHFSELSHLGITLDYRIIQEDDLAVISDSIISEILEQKYAEDDSNFIDFVKFFTSDRSDDEIKTFIERVHGFTSSMYDMEYWVKNMSYMYDSSIMKTFSSVLLEDLVIDCDFILSCYNKMIEICDEDEGKDGEEMGSFLAGEREGFGLMKWMGPGCASYQSAYDFATDNGMFEKMPRTTASFAERKAQIKALRDMCKFVFNERIRKKFIVKPDDVKLDCLLLKPVMKVFSKIVLEYEEKLLERKKEIGAFEFSDISRFAMSLFIDEKGDRTALADEVSAEFDEIYIDECQDTNSMQNLFFDTISRGGKNLFLVGDAKQSIYRFRQAEPELFIDRLHHLPKYTPGADGGYILLKENFRSSKGVIDFVNFIFSRVMSNEVGDIAYDETQALSAGRDDFPDSVCPAELHLLSSSVVPAGEKMSSFEQRYLAHLIKEKVESGEQILDEKTGEMRPVEYDDFCVLLRSTTKLSGYIEAFEEQGIPTYSVASSGFYERSEIVFVRSFMKAVGNPLNDIELMGIMHSEIFGFTAEELARLKVKYPVGSIYAKVVSASESGDEKCKSFLEEFSRFRSLFLSLTPCEFLERLYFEKGYYALVGATPQGESRQANLMMFLDMVQGFEKSGHKGMSALIRHIDAIAKNGGRTKCAYVASTGKNVTFMTIHASKGLQFPIVVLAEASANFKKENSDFIFHKKLGAGVRYKDTQYGYKNVTLPYAAIKTKNEMSEISEELRLLYVALTRAQQKIIIVGNIGKKSVEKCSVWSALSDECAVSCVKTAKSYMDFFLSTLVRHPKAQALRELSPFPECVSPCDGDLKVVFGELPVAEDTAPEETVQVCADEDLLRTLEERFSYSYPYSGIFGVAAKATASGLNASRESISDISFARPAFLDKSSLNSAGKGTALHRFMECADLSKLENEFDSQLELLVSKKFLSEVQAKSIDREKVTAFCRSPLYTRILSCDEYLREYRFSFLIDAGELDSSLSENVRDEKVLIQGVTDGVIINADTALIVDYKTDRVKTGEELARKYERQMRLYCRGIEEVLGKRVVGCVLYSFALGNAVEVKTD